MSKKKKNVYKKVRGANILLAKINLWVYGLGFIYTVLTVGGGFWIFAIIPVGIMMLLFAKTITEMEENEDKWWYIIMIPILLFTPLLALGFFA